MSRGWLRTPSVVPGALGETLRTQSRVLSKFDRPKLIRTRALGFFHDAATTAPYRSPSFFGRHRCCHRLRSPKMRPADFCNSDYQRRAPMHPVPTDAERVASPCISELRGSRRRNPLRLVASDLPGAYCSHSGASLRVASGVSSLLGRDQTGWYASEKPRVLLPPSREKRQLSTSRNAFHRQPNPDELGNSLPDVSPTVVPSALSPKIFWTLD